MFFFFKDQRKKDGRDFESDTMSTGERKLTMLLGNLFFNISILSFLSKVLCSVVVFVSQLKLSFSDTCQRSSKQEAIIEAIIDLARAKNEAPINKFII